VKSARLLFLFALLLNFTYSGCVKKAERVGRTDFSKYLPLGEGNYFIYSGPLGKALVHQTIGNLYSVVHYDSAGEISFWTDFVKTDHSILWKNIVFRSPRLAPIHFEPGLPFVPWTNQVGDTLLFSSAAIIGDSVNSHLRIQIEYEIYGIGSATTPAGRFDDCIEIRMTPKELYEKGKNAMTGDYFCWFAKNMGIVKYSFPGGAGELLQAKIDGRRYP
jgi:hypothetical protein